MSINTEYEAEPEWQRVPDVDGDATLYWRQPFTHALRFRMGEPSGVSEDDDPEDWHIEADVKWDGCINWQTSPDRMYHFCDPSDVVILSRAFDRMWAFALANLDTADAGCFARKIKIPD